MASTSAPAGASIPHGNAAHDPDRAEDPHGNDAHTETYATSSEAGGTVVASGTTAEQDEIHRWGCYVESATDTVYYCLVESSETNLASATILYSTSEDGVHRYVRLGGNTAGDWVYEVVES